MVKKLKGETPSLPAEEDRGTNLVAANENLNQDPEELTELEELVDVMEEWTKQMEALDRRVTALEEKDVNKMEEEEDVNKMEGLDRRVAALEVYVEKVGEDSPKDVKTRQKNGKGVKRTMHTLDDNLSRTMTRSKKQK
ncbi:hypothetical protein Bca101_010290 [Brassica carinata]